MNTIQYTIRSITPELDRLIRKKALLTGKSLNRVIVDDIKSVYGLNTESSGGALAGLEWFVGKGSLEESVLVGLNDEDKIQKSITKQEFNKLEQ